MANMLAEVELAIPEAGILISLAHGNMPDILLTFANRFHIIITDVVKYEVTRKLTCSTPNGSRPFFGNRRIELPLRTPAFMRIWSN